MQQVLHRPTFLKSFARIHSVLERILIAARSARSRRTAMHPTTSFTPDCWRSAWFTRARFGSAAWAGEHRASITRMVRRHLPLCLRWSRRTVRFADDLVGGRRASASTGVTRTGFFRAISCAGPVTFPIVGWLPSLTDTCCTIAFSSFVAR